MRGNTFIRPETVAQFDMPKNTSESYPWHSGTFSLTFHSQNTLKHTRKKNL